MLSRIRATFAAVTSSLILIFIFAAPVFGQAPFGEAATIETAGGQSYVFRTRVAITPEDQARGYMFYENLPDDEGMLFPFPRAKRASFWMRDVPIHLDVVFVKSSGEIANIAVNAKPYDETSLPSKGWVIAVFEVRGGLTKELGIKAGDVIRHPALGNVDE